MRCDDRHAVKLIQNHSNDNGFEYNGVKITTKSIGKLAQLEESNDLKIVPGLIGKMLNVAESELQKVK